MDYASIRNGSADAMCIRDKYIDRNKSKGEVEDAFCICLGGVQLCNCCLAIKESGKNMEMILSYLEASIRSNSLERARKPSLTIWLSYIFICRIKTLQA